MNENEESKGSVVCFCADDGYIVGLKEVVLEAIMIFKTALKKRTNSTLVKSKCKLYSRNTVELRNYLAANPEYEDFTIGALGNVDIKKAKTSHGCGMIVVGIPVGDTQYIKTKLAEKAAFLKEDLQKLTTLLSKRQSDMQIASALTLWCHHPRVDYILQNLPPNQMEWYHRLEQGGESKRFAWYRDKTRRKKKKRNKKKKTAKAKEAVSLD